MNKEFTFSRGVTYLHGEQYNNELGISMMMCRTGDEYDDV